MGYMRHHAIVVTCSYGDHLKKAHAEATRLDMRPSPVIDSHINGEQSFLVPPDGSKEGWGESSDGDERRNTFVEYMNRQRYGDGSGPLDWAEVMYGDDNGECDVVRHGDEIESGDDYDGPADLEAERD